MNRLPRLSKVLTGTSRQLRQLNTNTTSPALLHHAASHTPQKNSRPALLLYASSSFATATFVRTHVAHAEQAHPTNEHLPTHQNAPQITLYQYQVCPFCNKVRAYLDYYGVAYSVVEVDPLRKTELKQLEDKEYRKVPIAVVNGQQINGSGAVIDTVSRLIGQDASTNDVEKHWLQWLDNTLIRFIAPNIYRTPSESLQTFEYITEHAKFSAWQKGTIRYSGAAAMYFVGQKLKKKYGIVDERRELVDALVEWTDAVRQQGGVFLAGSKPGIADLSIYGVLKSIQNFDTFTELRERNTDLAQWFDRMKDAVGDDAIVSSA